MDESFTISVVIPVFNEYEMLFHTYYRTKQALQPMAHEIIFVDDGSTDRSREALEELASTDKTVKVVALSRNFGHQSAVTAGLQHTQGDAIVIMDADLQDPPELIRKFIDMWQQGYDVVYGVRKTRNGEPFLKRITAHVFYRALRKLSNVDIPADVGDFRLMSRRVVNILNQMPEYHRYLRGMVAWTGFRQVGVSYIRDPRVKGITHYSWKHMWYLSLDGITSFSVEPLRWVRRVALFVAVVAFAISLWLVYQKLTHPHSLVLGWTSMMVTVLWLGTLQLGVLGIIGEYVGRIMEQGRQRPKFVVDRTLNMDTGDSENLTPDWSENGGRRAMDIHRNSIL